MNRKQILESIQDLIENHDFLDHEAGDIRVEVTGYEIRVIGGKNNPIKERIRRGVDWGDKNE